MILIFVAIVSLVQIESVTKGCTPSISEDDESEDDDESDEGIMHLVCACCML